MFIYLSIYLSIHMHIYMLGGWVNPHREQQTIPQGQTSIPPKSLSTPTANGQSAPQSGSARGVGRGAGSHTPSKASESHSHELPALTALAQHISHSHSGIDEKGPTEKFEYIYTYIYIYIYMYIHTHIYIYIYIYMYI